MPSNILTVYRLSVSSEELIAKKVREGSNELEILQLLNNIHPKSDHVISLIDSIHGQSRQWVILPKMSSVMNYVLFAPRQLESKVVQVCLGLIKGLAYLHEHCIAHRDIKPDNLLVDQDFCLKIIDFDVAIRVKDGDEEVDDQCGTKLWIAPEAEKKLKHSPIKADRWTCGHVLLVLLDGFEKEDKLLRAFVRNLNAYDPKQRPSLLEWPSYLAAGHSDVGNVWNADKRKEVDGEDGKSPNAEKQRLSGP
jgi:serine/threonine protein kinase